LLALVLALEGGETIEEQLTDVGLGDGVTAVDAFARDLLEEIAEVAIDGGGGGEILDSIEEFVRDGFAGLGSRGIVLGKVMGAERVVVLGDERAAAMAAGVDVAAV
jgi:hypothetical protein